MTVAIADALLRTNKDVTLLSKEVVVSMRAFGRSNLNKGFGMGTLIWLLSTNPQPYNSNRNGAAMRVSACGLCANSIEEAKILSKTVTEVTHNHPEGIKGAESVAVAIYLAKTGASIEEIKDYITKNYYAINFTIDEIRATYTFDAICQGSVPQAFEAFFESTGFEDAIRNAVSIGGDSDTIAAIAGSIAEPYYGIPTEIREKAITYLEKELLDVVIRFENTVFTE